MKLLKLPNPLAFLQLLGLGIQTFLSISRTQAKNRAMRPNIISFNNLIARISECRKRMTIVRREILLNEETGKNPEHQKRELFNLSNQISMLQERLQSFQNKSKLQSFR